MEVARLPWTHAYGPRRTSHSQHEGNNSSAKIVSELKSPSTYHNLPNPFNFFIYIFFLGGAGSRNKRRRAAGEKSPAQLNRFLANDSLLRQVIVVYSPPCSLIRGRFTQAFVSTLRSCVNTSSGKGPRHAGCPGPVDELLVLSQQSLVSSGAGYKDPNGSLGLDP